MSYDLLIDFFQCLLKGLVSGKQYQASETNSIQNLMNYHWKKLLTKIALFKNIVLPNFPNLVKSSKRLEIVKKLILYKDTSSDIWQNTLYRSLKVWHQMEFPSKNWCKPNRQLMSMNFCLAS